MSALDTDGQSSRHTPSRSPRRRLALSCSHCRFLHRRCDRARPFCGACLNIPVQVTSCVYISLGTEDNTPGFVPTAVDVLHTSAAGSLQSIALDDSSPSHTRPVLSFGGGHEGFAALWVIHTRMISDAASPMTRDSPPAVVSWGGMQEHLVGTPPPPQETPILSTTCTESVSIGSWTHRLERLSASHDGATLESRPTICHVGCTYKACQGHLWSLDGRGNVSTTIDGCTISLDPLGKALPAKLPQICL